MLVMLPFDQQMNVVRHQTVGVKIEWQLGLLVGELKEELAIVVVRTEDESTIVATGDDVIKPALDLDSRFAHRGLRLLPSLPIVNCILQACELHFASLTSKMFNSRGKTQLPYSPSLLNRESAISRFTTM